MTEQEHYSLRWNNHQNHILRAFDALLQTKSLVDVTLVCAESSVRAHKVVLSACSPFFQNVFAENPCKHPVIVLKDYPGWVVKAIVDFMYRGEISVPQKRLEQLIQAGESLQIRGLVEHRGVADNLQLAFESAAAASSSTDDYLDRSILSNTSIELNATVEETFDDDVCATAILKTDLNDTQNGTKHSNNSNLFTKTNPLNIEREQNEPNSNNNNINTTNHYSHPNEINREINSTSPMPRRKQARPRRRSGECGPHDFSTSQPATPTSNDDNEQQQHQQQQQPLTINKTTDNDTVEDAIAAEQRKFDERNNAIASGCRTAAIELDTDKVVDCTVAAMEQSLKQNKLNQNERDISDNEMDDDDDDDEGNDMHNVHDDDDMEGDEDDMDENEHEHDAKIDIQNLRKRSHQFMCDDGDMSEPEHNSRIDDDNDDLEDDGDGPENLCIKNQRDSGCNQVLGNGAKINKDNNTSTSSKNCSTNNNNRIGLSLKDIRHLNRPQSHLSRPSLFGAFHPAHLPPLPQSQHQHQHQQQHQSHHIHQSNKDEHAQSQPKQQQRANEQIQNQTEHLRQSQPHQMASGTIGNQTHNSQSFLEQRAENFKREAIESRLENENAYMDQVDLQLAAAAAAYHNATGLHHTNSRHPDAENNLHKEFTPSSPMSLQNHFNPREGPPHPPSPLQFPGMTVSSALTLTPPHHMFGLDSPLSLFPPGMDPGKLYNPLMEMSDPRSMHPHPHGPYLKKKNKLSRPKGQHSAPRGGPPRSWTNAELTEALHHVWNKKMTTSQASRLFGIPYNSLLMYVRGKYGKSLNLEQLRKGCISGPPIELLTMGLGAAHTNNNGAPSSKSGLNSNRTNKELKELDENHRHEREREREREHSGGRASSSNLLKRSTSSEPDLLSNPSAMFNPFPPGFYSDFAAGFPGLPLSMLNLLPPDRHPPMHGMQIDEDCKSDRSKQSLEDEYPLSQPLALNRDDRRELLQQNGQD